MLSATKKPLVATVVVIYGEYRFIKETIESLLAQNYENVDISICGSCSTNGSAKMCKAASESQRRTRQLRQERNFGPPAKSIFTLEQAGSNHVMSAADHDSWASTLFGRCVEAAEKMKRFKSGEFGTEGSWINRKPPLPRLPIEQVRSFLHSDLRWIHRLTVVMAILPAFLVRYLAGRLW